MFNNAVTSLLKMQYSVTSLVSTITITLLKRSKEFFNNCDCGAP